MKITDRHADPPVPAFPGSAPSVWENLVSAVSGLRSAIPVGGASVLASRPSPIMRAGSRLKSLPTKPAKRFDTHVIRIAGKGAPKGNMEIDSPTEAEHNQLPQRWNTAPRNPVVRRTTRFHHKCLISNDGRARSCSIVVVGDGTTPVPCRNRFSNHLDHASFS